MARMNRNPLEAMGFDADKERESLGIEATEEKRGRPQRKDLVHENGVQAGLPEDWTRATFIVRCELLEKLKDYAYTERVTLKDALNTALEQFLEDKTDLLPHKK